MSSGGVKHRKSAKKSRRNYKHWLDKQGTEPVVLSDLRAALSDKGEEK